LLRLFLEAKLFTNYFIANGIANLSHRDYKVDSVPVKVGDDFQEREICALSSHMGQALIKQTTNLALQGVEEVSSEIQQKKKHYKLRTLVNLSSLR
jgi:hypothetical protein